MKPEQILAANFFCEKIIAKMGKVFHVILADRAAPKYDAKYGKDSFGTALAMEAEERQICRVVENLKSRKRAVELGCGTGRHSFFLSKYFEEVVGYDFSQGMVDLANEKKTDKVKKEEIEDSGVKFDVRDVEDLPLAEDDGEFDFVLGSFGMGSFVEDIESFSNSIRYRLSNEGACVLSFYNDEALRYLTQPPWRDSTLSAEFLIGISLK